ncbi:MAG TPA: amino acid adenylation domain-containing protein, partial [Ktedonobacteraceae bacterium]
MTPEDFEAEKALEEKKSELFSLLLAEQGFHTPPRQLIAGRKKRTGLPVALAFEQEQLWFLAQLEPANPSYNVALVLRMEGPLQVSILEASLNALLARHESLRTCFHARNGQPFQVIRPAVPLLLPLLDISDLSTGPFARETALKQINWQEASTPFALEQAPLLRARLVRWSPQQHCLLLTFHHIIFDGWSQKVLLRELGEIYRAGQAGKPVNLPPLPIQYADYACWQRDWLQGETLATELAYWQGELAHAPVHLALPADYPRSSGSDFAGATWPFSMSAQLTARLQAFAMQEGCTLYMLALAGLEVVLSRYSGQNDFLLGTPLAHRPAEETEGLIGMLVNILAIRADVSGRPTGRELARRVRERVLQAQGHPGLPLRKLVELVQPERQESGATPLVQVSFAWEEAPLPAHEMGPGLWLHIEPWTSQTAKFELTFFAWETEAGLAGAVEYATALYEAATIERLVVHWQRILEELVAHPEQPVGQLDLLTVTEGQQLLRDWNATQAYSPEGCVHQLFEAQVARTPDSVAVVFEQEQLTYHQLNIRANQLAHFLQNLGIGPEVRVGLALERSPEMIVAFYGILKAGGVYVPLDPTYPSERLAYLLKDAQVPVLLTQQSVRPKLPVLPRGVQLVCLESARDRVLQQPTSAPHSTVQPANLAYMIYTSGSTGLPKGTLLTHQGPGNLAQVQWHICEIAAGTRILQFSSLSFDAAIWDITAALLNGATLCLAPPDKLLAGEPLLATLREQAISAVTLPPSALSVLPVQELPALANLIVGGEACPADIVTRWSQGRRFINAYGPTEICVCATMSICLPDGRKPSIGRPMANVQAYVLDARGMPVPVGVTGELYLGSAGIARGYLNRPDLTAERFVPDPWGDKPGARLYRTGDLVRWQARGVLEYVGRIDGQVKVRGYRVECGEIEHRLQQHPGVHAAVVMLREDRAGDQRLVAYLSGPADDGEAAPAPAEALRQHLLAWLPGYMVPAAFVWLGRLPLTPHGKVDRRALPAPRDEPTAALAPEQGPQSPLEEVLAGVWCELLGVRQVSRQANFFALGGHSLLATQLISQVRSRLHVDVPLRALFEAQTLAGLAQRIEKLRPIEPVPLALPLPALPRPRVFPLSFAQQRLWFLAQLEPGNTAYNIPVAYSLKGYLRLKVLQQSFYAMISRHESLRTTFAIQREQPVQLIKPAFVLRLPVIDLEHIPQQERPAEVRQLALAEARQAFALDQGPLLRATLLRLCADEHVLLLTMHHIISDGWSMGILLKELGVLYSAFAAGQQSPLAALPLQYADYVTWQRDWLQGEKLAARLAYWKHQLADWPATSELPTDYPRPAVQSFRGAYQSLTISRRLTEKLKTLSQEQGGTLFMALVGAFSLLLARCSGQDEFLIGTPIAGRTRSEVEGLIGFFLNTLVLRVNLQGAPGFRQVVERIREVTLGAYAHQDLPFEQLVEA